MVKEESELEMPVRKFITDDGRFVIKIKGLSLERFETKLCNDKFKADASTYLLRQTMIDTFLLFRAKSSDKFVGYTMADRLRAVEEFRKHLFSAYEVELN